MKVQSQAMGAGRAAVTPTDANSASAGRRSGVVWFWALCGVGIVALFLNNWGRWLLSSEFVRPDPGPDPYPHMFFLRSSEFMNCAIFLVLGWLCVVKPWLRKGVPSFDGKLFIGGVFASTLDILFASINPTWSMNAYGYSFGSWANFIPGFPAPGASEIPWGLLWCLPSYIWLGVGAAMFGSALLRLLRGWFAQMSMAGLYSLLGLVYMVLFASYDFVCNRLELYTYLSIPEGLALWYGETYQWPIYSGVLIAIYCLCFTWLRESRDENDRCAIDREVDTSAAYSRGVRETISALTICGYAAMVTICAYQVPFTWFSAFGTGNPTLPSYLQSGIYCGQPGKPQCPGQYLKQLRDEEIRRKGG